MLRHIELRMETLTQEQEILNQKKVNLDVILFTSESIMNSIIICHQVEIARVTCEKERRHREKEVSKDIS